MGEFFTEVSERIPFEGPDSDTALAFHWYDADRVVAGRRMEDHLRFAVCFWHSFNWDGFDIFGAGTMDRPWHPTFAPTADPLVVWDELGAGNGSLIALSEGAEAAQPFRPDIKPVDAYNAGTAIVPIKI